MRSHCQQYTG